MTLITAHVTCTVGSIPSTARYYVTLYNKICNTDTYIGLYFPSNCWMVHCGSLGLHLRRTPRKKCPQAGHRISKPLANEYSIVLKKLQIMMYLFPMYYYSSPPSTHLTVVQSMHLGLGKMYKL